MVPFTTQRAAPFWAGLALAGFALLPAALLADEAATGVLPNKWPGRSTNRTADRSSSTVAIRSGVNPQVLAIRGSMN